MRARSGRDLRDLATGVAMLLPSLVVVVVFVLYPLVRSAWIGAFVQDPFGGHRRFVGLDQYAEVVSSAEFRNSVWVTIRFALLTVPTSLVLGTALAVLGNQHLRGIRVFRTIFASTLATSIAVASMLWIALLDPTTGILNHLLRALGLDPIDVLGNPRTALIGVSLVTVWQQLGLVFVVMIAAMQSIPEVLYESARVDGHGPGSRFVWITLPLLGPQLLFLTIVTTVGSFQAFTQVDILTEGGPRGSTDVLVYSIVEDMPLDQGRASVEAVLLFLVVGLLSAIQFRWLDRRVDRAG